VIGRRAFPAVAQAGVAPNRGGLLGYAVQLRARVLEPYEVGHFEPCTTVTGTQTFTVGCPFLTPTDAADARRRSSSGSRAS